MKTNILKGKNTDFLTKPVIKSGSKLLDLTKPLVMGILNITPDSFYQSSRVLGINNTLKLTEKMIADGASILDFGAVSTRPGAVDVSKEEELTRLMPVIQLIRKIFPDIWISIDTSRSSIAEMMINEGADIINDISGGIFDENMPKFIGTKNIPFVIMHTKGKPKDMQIDPEYIDVTKDVDTFFKNQIKILNDQGATQLILDPGFGFGKTVEHNYQLLNKLDKFKKHQYPVLVGMSRKSMINKVLKTIPENALNGTTAVNMVALLRGANILRVHDVKEAVEAIKIFSALQKK